MIHGTLLIVVNLGARDSSVLFATAPARLFPPYERSSSGNGIVISTLMFFVSVIFFVPVESYSEISIASYPRFSRLPYLFLSADSTAFVASSDFVIFITYSSLDP